ncbi:MAG TPA: hypothetical protein VH274_04020, partial [Mycobacteriales bacterium]|nr:hypothetical protein [Mycobacteriales bacterium]
MVRKLLVVLSAATMVLVALPAAASSGSITDPKGDETGCSQGAKADCDIVSAAWGHRSHGRLMHQVTVAGTAATFAAGPEVLPRLYIDVPGQKFDNPTCDYFVDSSPPGAGQNTTDHFKYYVNTC